MTSTGPAPAAPGRMSKAEFQQLYDRLRAQPSWGPADRRGALNYLTPATMLAAPGEVKLGRSVSFGGPVEYGVMADNPEPARHMMTQTGDSAPAGGLSFAMDRIGMNIHGYADTHIDALSHVIYDAGSTTTGQPISSATPELPSSRSPRPRTASSVGECCWTCPGHAASPGSSREIT